MMADLEAKLEGALGLQAVLEPPVEIVVQIVGSGPPGPPGAAGTTDHAKLTGRDTANQHPIQAIESLRDELISRPKESGVLTILDEQITEMTNQDVLRLWNSL